MADRFNRLRLDKLDLTMSELWSAIENEHPRPSSKNIVDSRLEGTVIS